ncbi:MAG: mandelate racemase/muconate lactonizing enzyme family protein [Pseudomonadota bacterium]
MIITKAEVIQLSVPFSDPGSGEGLFQGAWKALDFVLLRLETQDGLVGWGEAFSYFCADAVAAMVRQCVVPLLEGQDVSDMHATLAQMRQKLQIVGRYGITMFAISAADIALHDLAAKARGISVAELLGGPRRKDVPAYASLIRYGEPGLVRDMAGRAASEGYGMIKLHEIEEAPIRAGRDGAGALALTNDVNCNWSVDQTRQLAPMLREIDLLWLEEPIFPPEDYTTLAALRAETGLAIATGENTCTEYQFAEVIRAGAADYVQPSVTKIGGLAETMATRARAMSAGVQVAHHAPYFGPGYLATLQVLATAQADEWFEYLYIDREDDLYREMPLPTHGRVSIPQGPGLGADPDPNMLDRFAV